jgi:transcription elongation factor Elf1
MNCPKCNKKGYPVTTKIKGVVKKTWYCSYCMIEWEDKPEAEKEKTI